MHLINKSPKEIVSIIRKDNPEIDAVLALSNSVKQHYKGTIMDYQAACLYALVKPYNNSDTRILEIGTGLGFSTSFLSQACPQSEIITLSVRPDESEHAKNIIRNNLGFKNVEFVIAKSWEYAETNIELYNVIFVDGDHAKVQKDLVFWEQLNEGGLMLFHDYCPEYAANPQPHVFATLNAFRERLGRAEFDVKIIDNSNIGMVGLYK